jgi:hypothetical protein
VNEEKSEEETGTIEEREGQKLEFYTDGTLAQLSINVSRTNRGELRGRRLTRDNFPLESTVVSRRLG